VTNFKRKQGEGETESEKAAGKMKAMAKKMEEGCRKEKEQMEEDENVEASIR
jgi:hypothetical protein